VTVTYFSSIVENLSEIFSTEILLCCVLLLKGIQLLLVHCFYKARTKIFKITSVLCNLLRFAESYQLEWRHRADFGLA